MNIDEVVKRSGVSRSTVFRFLRGNNVRAHAKQSILDAMKSLGYEDQRVTGLNLELEIEISATEDVDSFLGFTRVINGVIFAAEELGIKVRLVRRNLQGIPSAYDGKSHKNKGVIVLGKNFAEETLEGRLLSAHKIPHVFVNRVFDEPGISYVAADLVRAGYDITRHLIDEGRRRIAICGDCETLRADKDKIQGYRQAMSESDIPVSDKLCITNAGKHDMDQFLEAILDAGQAPDAFVGICDAYAMRLASLAEQRGYRIPEDIAVVGMDGVSGGEFFRPALTTVHIPFYEIGLLAVDSLYKQMTRGVTSMKTVVEHSLVIRQSSKGAFAPLCPREAGADNGTRSL